MDSHQSLGNSEVPTEVNSAGLKGFEQVDKPSQPYSSVICGGQSKINTNEVLKMYYEEKSSAQSQKNQSLEESPGMYQPVVEYHQPSSAQSDSDPRQSDPDNLAPRSSDPGIRPSDPDPAARPVDHSSFVSGTMSKMSEYEKSVFMEF